MNKVDQKPSVLEQKTDAEFIRVLREEFGWKVEGPTYTAVPEPKPRYFKFNEQEYFKFNEHIQSLKAFLLETYIIEDHFGEDHRIRRKFWMELRKDKVDLSAWIEKHSRLRGTKLLDAVIAMGTVQEKIRKYDSELYEKLTQIFTPHVHVPTGDYIDNKFSLKEKVEVANRVYEASYRFLRAISE